MTTPMPTPADATRCPLCGGDNRCAMEIAKATGEPQPPCWCVGASFPPELLARIPEAARGAACLCPDCVKAAARPAG